MERDELEAGCLPVEVDEQSDAQCSGEGRGEQPEQADDLGPAGGKQRDDQGRHGRDDHERGEDRKVHYMFTRVTNQAMHQRRAAGDEQRVAAHEARLQLAQLPGGALHQAGDADDRAVDDLLVDDLAR